MRILWPLLFIVSTLMAALPANMLSTLQSNPSLLDSPEGKIMLQKYGVSEEAAKKALNGKTEGKIKLPSETTLQNDINLTSNDINITRTGYTEENITRRNPLVYTTGDQLIQEILQLQQKRLDAKGLHHFGFNFFSNANTFDPAILPTPDYYLLTPADVLVIQIYGSTNKTYTLPVDNNGEIMIPVIGPKRVGGKEFGNVKKELALTLEKTIPGIKATVNIQKFSTIQVVLTGEAKAPGIYNLPSLSTIQTLLVQAKGVLPTGSLRDIEIYRNGKHINSVDLYKMLGNKPGKEILLHAGDIVHVDKAGREIAIYGEIKKPAIYELKKAEGAKTLLKLSGGLSPKASRDAIVVKRYDAHKALKTYRLTLNKFKRFDLQDGDEVCIYPLDSAKKENIYLFGNVVKPGPRALTKETSSLHALLHKEAPKSFNQLLLPDTYLNYAYIKRRLSDLKEKIIGFDLKKVYTGEKDITLQKEDEIYFLNRYDVMQNPYVTIDGQVLKAGLYRYIDGMKLNDLVKAAGIKRMADDNIQITTYATPDHLPKTIIVNIKSEPNFPLHPYDEIYLFDYYKTHTKSVVTIGGEVVKPGKYAIKKGTTLKDIINVAGGLTEKASTRGEVIRYHIKNDEREREVISFDMDNAPKTTLKNHDMITIFRISNWNNPITVTLKGEVKYPGTYLIKEGDTLSSVIDRAGGFTKDAFVQGAVFTRESVKKMQKKQLDNSLNQLKKNAMIIASQPQDFGTGQVSVQELLTSIDAIIKQAKETEPIGRLSINIPRDIKKLKGSDSNIVLKDKDTLYIPTKNDTISVLGEVLNPTALIYHKGDSPWDCIQRAGGLSDNANKDSIFIVHANGEAQKLDNGMFVISTPTIKPGDTIVVPINLKTHSNMQFAKDATQIIYQLAVGVAALNTIGVF